MAKTESSCLAYYIQLERKDVLLDCGLSKGSSKVQATVALDSVDTPLGVFPWHGGIYQREGQDWKYICGGSLITKRIVLTAAHKIITDSNKNLLVALAKYYRGWHRD